MESKTKQCVDTWGSDGLLLETILGNVPISMCTIDREGTFTFAGGKGLELLGIPPSRLIGVNVYKAFGENRTTVESVRQALAGHPVNLIAPYAGRWLDLRCMPVRGADGQVDGIALVALDITDRMTVEKEGRAAHSALEGAIDGFALVDRRNRIVSVNSAYCRLSGYSADELIGRDRFEFIHPDDRPKLLAALDKLWKDGRAEAEVRGIRRDGSFFYKRLVLCACFDDTGDSYYSYVSDISQYKELQTQLLHADRMVAIGTLAAGIAHEINNPLTYVITNLQLIAEESGAENPTLHKLVSEAADGAERVRAIVRGLKVFSRSGEERLGAVDVHQVIESAVNMAMNEIRHRANLVVQHGDVPFAQANEGRLAQVVLNLLINSAHAIQEGNVNRNRITVATRLAPNGWVAIEVSDTGCGIAAANLARVFDPFFTTKPVGVGTGLGLSICHGIVKSFGGEIQVESVVGRGTTFRILLEPARIAVKPVQATEGAAAETVPSRRSKIMIIDDEIFLADALKKVLSKEHDVTVATTGKEGLASIIEDPTFDLVFCDLMMPDLTGMDIYDRLMMDDSALPERFVFMTGGAFTQKSREFLERVPNCRIEKPFDLKSIRTLVQALTRTRA